MGKIVLGIALVGDEIGTQLKGEGRLLANGKDYTMIERDL